jgi:ribonuclease-3
MLNNKFGNLIDKVRLLFRKDKESYLCFYRMLGFYPRNIRIYEQALLHKSSSVKSDKGRLLNNERLEFLGDAILDAVVGDIVYQKFDGKREGFLTNTRSKIVSRESLNRLAEQIGLLKLIKFNTRQSAHNSYMGGNAFEALVGAIYLDRGYEYCKFFMERRIIGQYLDLNKVSRKEVNFKSKLIEWTQKNKVEIVFELVEQSYDEFNSPIFESEILIEGIHACKGKGYSKKESQQIAAHETLNKIKKDAAFVESVFAAKAKREGQLEEQPEEVSVDNAPVEQEAPIMEMELSRRPDDMEEIIRAAEEAAYMDTEKQEDA